MITDITIPFIEKQHRWSIGVFESRDDFRFYPAKGVKQPVIDIQHVTDAKAKFVADPFMVREKGRWYLFFEMFDAITKKGRIALAESEDARAWHYRQVVLSEAFHLSYPFVFKHEGRYFLVPESASQQAVRLYEAVDFPVRWKYVKDLLKGERFADATLFYHEKKWWMFTGTGPVAEGTLSLYFAEDLMGPWQKHPSSPITSGYSFGARPAGKVIETSGRLIRLAQMGAIHSNSLNYGKWIRAFEIVKLSSVEYEEKEISDTPLPKGLSRGPWNKDGMHHIDAHPTENGRWLACVDGFRYIYRYGRGREMRLKDLWV